MYYELIKRYYVEGYGFPRKFYTDADLEVFISKNMITQEEANKIKSLKK